MHEKKSQESIQELRKNYGAPELKVYGGMAQLTAAGTKGGAEGQGQSKDDPLRKK